MLATLGGCLALLLGIAVLLLPLLTPELSRPRDAFWGAVVLLLGLVLVTSSERLTGAPMLAVLCGGLLIGRLSTEVGRSRWNQLSTEERSALATAERWASGLQQLAAAAARLLLIAQTWIGALAGWLAARRQPKSSGKRWVRPENDRDDTGTEAPSATGVLAEAVSPAPAEIKPDAEIEPEAAIKPEAKIQPEAGIKPEAEIPPDAESQAAASIKPEAEIQAEAGIQPESEIEPAAEITPEPERQPEPVSTATAAEGTQAPGAGAAPVGVADAAPSASPIPPEASMPDSRPLAPPQDAGQPLPEEVEVEILDPPPPQRHVPDFHAIDALLRASGALPAADATAPPPLAEAEMEPPEQGSSLDANGSPRP